VLVAETVREESHCTQVELPFSTAVIVNQFDESERSRSCASLHDLRGDGEQKPIIIGAAAR
jgi:GTPase Era involved in 16S rRNA processing